MDVCTIDLVQTVKSQVFDICELLENYYQLYEEFQVIQKRVLKQNQCLDWAEPNDTNVNSILELFTTVFVNEKVSKELLLESRRQQILQRYATSRFESSYEREWLHKILAFIASEDFWNTLKLVVDLIDPLASVLREFQSDSCKTSRVYDRFQWLQRHEVYLKPRDGVLESDQAKIISMIEACWSDAHSSALGIAFLLDPNMNIEDFVGADEENTMGQASDYAVRSNMLEKLGLGATREQFNRELYHFASVKLQWTNDEKAQFAGTNPCDWWMVRRRSFPLLSELADRVFNFPTYSTGDCRIWSFPLK